MATQLQSQHPNKRQRPHWRFRIHWIVVSIVLIVIIVFAVAAILILINEGISHGLIILTILSLIVGVVVSLLGLMFNFFQWVNSKPSHVPDPLVASLPLFESIDTTARVPSVDLLKSSE